MVRIRTVLCPVDFSPMSERALELGITLARRFQARLILHHNLDGAPPGAMGVSWMWSEEHRGAEQSKEEQAKNRLQALVEETAKQVPTEGRMSRGPLDDALLRVVEETRSDFVVMGTHGRSTDEHHSATQDFLEQAPCPVLTLRDHGADTSLFAEHQGDDGRTFDALVPLDFADYSLAAAGFAFALAEELPLRLHLLNVKPLSRRRLGKRRQADVETDESRARRHETQECLEALVPEALRPRVDCSVTDGKIGEEILTVAQRLRPDLVVMGTHRKNFFRKVLEGAPSHELLYGSGCPVLFVSETASHKARVLTA